MRRNFIISLFFIYFSCTPDQDLVSALDISGENTSFRKFTLRPVEDFFLQGGELIDSELLRVEEQKRISFLVYDTGTLFEVGANLVETATLNFKVAKDNGFGKLVISSANFSSADLESDYVDILLEKEIVSEFDGDFNLDSDYLIDVNLGSLGDRYLILVLEHFQGNDFALKSRESSDFPKLDIELVIPGDLTVEEKSRLDEFAMNSDSLNEDIDSGSNSGSDEQGSDTSNDSQESDSTDSESNESNGNGNSDGSNDQTNNYQGIYYVAPEGVSNNSGLNEDSPMNIEAAFRMAESGDIIYVKAGDYNVEGLSIENSGTVQNPIYIKGYMNTPGDLDDTLFKGNFDPENPNLMPGPVIKYNRINDEGEGTGLSVEENHVEISNIQIAYFKRGLSVLGDHCKINNVFVFEVGDFNPANSYPSGTNNAFLNYSGVGIILGGNGIELSNSIVCDAGAEGIRVNGGKNQIHLNNDVYSLNSLNPTDYYYLLHNGADENRFDNIYLYRKPDLSHNGHGFTFKADASFNELRNIHVLNTRIELSKTKVSYNIIQNAVIESNFLPTNKGGEGNGGILIANGANYNVLENIELLNLRDPIRFADWNESSGGGNDSVDAGNNNSFINVNVDHAVNGIHFDDFKNSNGPAYNNSFEDCSFKNLARFVRVDRPNNNNSFTNCILENVSRFEYTETQNSFSGSNTFVNCTVINSPFNL